MPTATPASAAGGGTGAAAATTAWTSSPVGSLASAHLVLEPSVPGDDAYVVVPATKQPAVVEDVTGTWALNVYGVWQQMRPPAVRLREQQDRMEREGDALFEL
jgi:hypothetical protein